MVDPSCLLDLKNFKDSHRPKHDQNFNKLMTRFNKYIQDNKNHIYICNCCLEETKIGFYCEDSHFICNDCFNYIYPSKDLDCDLNCPFIGCLYKFNYYKNHHKIQKLYYCLNDCQYISRDLDKINKHINMCHYRQCPYKDCKYDISDKNKAFEHEVTNHENSSISDNLYTAILHFKKVYFYIDIDNSFIDIFIRLWDQSLRDGIINITISNNNGKQTKYLLIHCYHYSKDFQKTNRYVRYFWNTIEFGGEDWNYEKLKIIEYNFQYL